MRPVATTAFPSSALCRYAALPGARRHLTVIGDSATLAHDRDLCALVEHLQRHARYRSAFELG